MTYGVSTGLSKGSIREVVWCQMVLDDASVCEGRLGALHYEDLVQALHVTMVDPLDILFKEPVLLPSVTEYQ